MKGLSFKLIATAITIAASGSSFAAPPLLSHIPVIGTTQTRSGLSPTIVSIVGDLPVLGPLSGGSGNLHGLSRSLPSTVGSTLGGIPILGPDIGGGGNLATVPLVGGVVSADTLLGVPLGSLNQLPGLGKILIKSGF